MLSNMLKAVIRYNYGMCALIGHTEKAIYILSDNFNQIAQT